MSRKSMNFIRKFNRRNFYLSGQRLVVLRFIKFISTGVGDQCKIFGTISKIVPARPKKPTRTWGCAFFEHETNLGLNNYKKRDIL